MKLFFQTKNDYLTFSLSLLVSIYITKELTSQSNLLDEVQINGRILGSIMGAACAH